MILQAAVMKLILQIHLRVSFVAGAPQAMSPDELTKGSLDRISLVHWKLKFLGLLLTASLLEYFVMGSHKDGAMSLGARHAGNPMRTVMTMAAKLKTVGDFAAFLLS